ncbi:MAG: delta-lactam-biosynthetic de-N-acetylase, partial [Hungatella sp.]|nr:delta-lactam-biosynthetic de-N-acetylase [Hungatella sp.]
TSSTNAQILDELLTKWEEMGYQFKSLDQLVAE